MRMFETFKRWLFKPSRTDFYSVFLQLYILVRAGRTLKDSIVAVSDMQSNKYLKQALKNIVTSLELGINTETAFYKENIFPHAVAPTVRAGDISGQLPSAFQKLSEIMRLEHSLYSKISSGLFIPKCAAVIMLFAVIGYAKVAIPQFLKLYRSSNVPIPDMLTNVQVAIDSLITYWFLIPFVFLLFVKSWGIFRKYYGYKIDRLKIKLPVYGELHKAILQYQMASTLGLMMASGLHLPDSLAQVAKVVENSAMAQNILLCKEDIMRGSLLAPSMRKYNIGGTFDDMLIECIAAGEEGHDFDFALNQCIEYYKEKILNMIDPVSTKVTLMVVLPMAMSIIALFTFTLMPIMKYIQGSAFR